MDYLLVADVFSKYIIVRKLPNSTTKAMCIELSAIVTEFGLPYIIKNDNGPCYSSKEFQDFLLGIKHQTSRPNHPRSNRFAERMAGVAKKLMDKARSERKPWISGLFDYRIIPPNRQHCISFATDDTAQTKGEKPPPAAQYIEMHQIYKELIRRQGNKPEREYQEPLPGTPVWVQHRQNATWESTLVVNETDAPNSYWIMQ